MQSSSNAVLDPTISRAVASIEGALNRMTLLPEEQDAAAEEIERLFEMKGVSRALNERVAQVAVACLSEAAASPDPSPLAVKWSCLVLAAVQPSLLPGDLVEIIVAALSAKNVAGHADSVFHVLDLLATVTADNAANRKALGERGVFPALLDAARQHKKELTVLFSVAFAVGALTMADVVNGGRAIDANALQVLVEIFKSGARARVADADLRKDTMKYSREAIMNLTKVPFDSAATAFDSIKWGKFGDLIEVDELKLDVEQERKRSLALLAAFRRAQKG
jgi:hypothetical protein